MKSSLLTSLFISLLITGCGIERNNQEFVELDLDFAEKAPNPTKEKQPEPVVSDEEEDQPVGWSTNRPPSEEESNTEPTPEIVVGTDNPPEESNDEVPELGGNTNQTPPESEPTPIPEIVGNTDQTRRKQ